MAEKRKAGKIARFVGELGIQLFAQIPFVDKSMDSLQKSVSRSRRVKDFANGNWAKHDSVAGQIGIFKDR